jgi:TolB-like protein/lipoprotein NlpI
MASLIPGYEYDIFISYRQKDNKGERWVTQFVDALKTELESTFKEEISVYFDINAHDGLLETHDVDASLKGKLKSLVFIPIISRTYCDPKSFAWEHEFKAFVEQASLDQFGLLVKLSNGNISNRVLPVRIHDLDNHDINLCESLLGGVLRGVEFVYKEPGVNRSLIRNDDERKNLNGTIYRNQLNKVALAIKEIISGLKKEPIESVSERKEVLSGENNILIKEKSIIVLPFENISSDPDQEYFSDGLTEEIITDLSHIHDLLVISRSSAMTFKGSKKKIGEIAKEVNVHYVLEGSVRKAGNNLRITAQLIEADNDSHLWAEKYTGTLDDIFDIQEKVSQAIVNSLKIKISTNEKNKLLERPIDNVSAYDCYLRAYHETMSFSVERLELALNLLNKGIEIIGENAVIYAGIALTYFQYANFGIEQDKYITKAEEFVNKAIAIDFDSAEAYFVSACIELTFRGNVHKALANFHRANAIKPDDPGILIWMVFGYDLVGKNDAAMSLVNRCIRIDPINPLNDLMKGIQYFFKGRFDLALNPILDMFKLASDSSMWQFWKSVALLYCDRSFESYEFIDKSVKEPGQDTISKLTIFLKYILKKDINKLASLLTPDFVKAAQIDCQISWHLATFYSYLGEKDKSLEWLENAVTRGFINYQFLNEYDKLLNNIRSEPRFKKLMERVKYEWENFEV